MKLFGDMSPKDRELAKELAKMETYFNKRENYPFPRELIAKAYVCLAHDYYGLHLEEEGDRLLNRANKVCACYFEKYMLKHMKEDEEFDYIVKNLTYHELANRLLVQLSKIGDKDVKP